MKSRVKDHLVNLRGWKTKRKIVVIESDDWGSNRMPSKKSYNNLLRNFIRVDNCPYNTFDSIETNRDLEALFEVLSSFKDKSLNYPVFTANTIMANPDFERIKANNFEKYFYEPFTSTLKNNISSDNVFNLYMEGIDNNIFKPQFHGREHLQINRWMKALNNKSAETVLAFNNRVYGLSITITNEKRKSYLAEFDFDNISEIGQQKEIIDEGLKLFEKTFKFRSKSFIGTNYIWHPKLEDYLAEKGVLVIQGARAQKVPHEGGYKSLRHYMGHLNKNKQVYLIRNVEFEPSLNLNKDWISSAMKQIDTAFKWKKPAIISSHRLNYMGTLDENNRKANLNLLQTLLRSIVSNWPAIEFMTSDQLGIEVLKAKNKI